MAISNLRAVSHLKKINDTSKQPTSKCKKKISVYRIKFSIVEVLEDVHVQWGY
jgi:hypothetical protein